MIRSIPAMFMRGGTSKALMFRRADLPADRSDWDAILLSVMGSPDRNGRQLNGMGGGTSSLSKVCVVGPPSRADADIDFTFAQVMIDEARVDYGINCGNMSSAVAPFAMLRGIIPAREGENAVRIFNTNTDKIIVASFAVKDGVPVEEGELEIPGVSGTGAPVRLDFLEPGGAATGKLLPGGAVAQAIEVPGLGTIEVSLVDAANACVIVTAEAAGMRGTESPDEIQNNAALMARLEAIRASGSVAMGIAKNFAEAAQRKAKPFFAIVSPPRNAKLLNGDALAAGAMDLTARVIASGQAHKALPLTVSLCIAVAARIEGSVAQRLTRKTETGQPPGKPLRLGMPSGVLTVDASVGNNGGEWHAERGSFYRTMRRLFDGVTFY